MKIITKTKDGKPACCLQKSEAFSLALRALFPDSLLEELLEQDESVFPEQDIFTRPGLDPADGGCEFCVVIMREENIAWLAAQDWIVDYTEYGHKSSHELRRLKKDIEEKFIEQEVEAFNKKDKSYRDSHFAEFGQEITKKQHQVASLAVLADFVNGKVDFRFPDEIYDEFRLGFFDRIADLFRRIADLFRRNIPQRITNLFHGNSTA